eukprot:CAMPEP_0169485994 /NCGR_PEP_ID=MMETSP1042-20121227/32583_1 /TAXON_ID=464988 /ORGANISM="Hemiselmis andersenii, Strain CCMP1180" /LENGTH=409 /DNA_ID=CAMNT_0009601121 /DNA_START=29 /DNA_END=1255 /DNA_ORIENTATION=+
MTKEAVVGPPNFVFLQETYGEISHPLHPVHQTPATNARPALSADPVIQHAMTAQVADAAADAMPPTTKADGATPGVRGGIRDVFRFATSLDTLLTGIGLLHAMATGMGIPIVAMIIRDIVNEGFTLGPLGIPPNLIFEMAFRILYLAAGLFGAAFLANTMLEITSSRQGHHARRVYLRALLRQEVAWIDSHRLGEIAATFEQECLEVEAAVGSELGGLFRNCSTAIGATCLALAQSWKMTLALFACLPLLAFVTMFSKQGRRGLSDSAREALSQSGALCDQAVSSVRTVASLCGERREVDAYESLLKRAGDASARLARLASLAGGVMVTLIFGSFVFGLWFGAHMQRSEEWNPAVGRYFNGADSALVFICVLLAAYHSAQLPPSLRSVQGGGQAAARVWELAERAPGID